MVAFNNNMLALPLLLLAAVQGYSGQEQSQLDHQGTEFTAVMRGISQALECFSGSAEESIRNQKQSSDALREMMLQLKEKMIEQNGKLDSMKIDKFTQEIRDVKQRLEDVHKKDAMLTKYIKDLQSEIKKKNAKVQELEKKLAESQQHSLQVELIDQPLSNLVQTQKAPECRTAGCEQQHLQEIKELVEIFNKNRDWALLRTGLEAVLESDSDEYRQLQQISYGSPERLWLIGRNGFSELASLLLCAGLPADSTDSNGYAMLDGAAQGGHLLLVKLLLERGAYVHVRSSNGNTPLSGAAATGQLEVVQWLVQAGADTTTKDQRGHTALDWAMGRGRVAVVQYLQQFPH